MRVHYSLGKDFRLRLALSIFSHTQVTAEAISHRLCTDMKWRWNFIFLIEFIKAGLKLMVLELHHRKGMLNKGGQIVSCETQMTTSSQNRGKAYRLDRSAEHELIS